MATVTKGLLAMACAVTLAVSGASAQAPPPPAYGIIIESPNGAVITSGGFLNLVKTLNCQGTVTSKKPPTVRGPQGQPLQSINYTIKKITVTTFVNNNPNPTVATITNPASPASWKITSVNVSNDASGTVYDVKVLVEYEKQVADFTKPNATGTGFLVTFTTETEPASFKTTR